MSVGHRIEKVKDAFGITAHDQWGQISPEEILAVHDVGPVTLDHVRIYLAARGLTLRDDQTPEFWQANLSAAKIGHQLGENDRATSSPITVLVDAGEKLPWTFQGLTEQDRPLIVPWVRQSLGPTWGDYSIRGWQGHCHVERKGVGDCVATALSHGTDRHAAFEATLERLSSIACGAVVVEGSLHDVIAAVRGGEHADQRTRSKQLVGQILAWQLDYTVPWIFAGDRRMAEVLAFRVMQRFWRHAMDERRRKQPKPIESANHETIDSILEAI